MTKYKTKLNEQGIAYLVKDCASNYKETLDNPEKINKMMCEVYDLHNETEECLYLLCLNTKNKLLGVFEVSRGTVNMAMVSPREVYQKSLLCNASNIIVCHNHPSHDCKPSAEDIKVTKRLKEAGELIGISLMDHIIVADTYRYYSFCENNI